MNLTSTTIEGSYYDGETPLTHPALLSFKYGEVALSGDDLSITSPMNTLNVSPRVGRADRFITLPGGGQFQCGDEPFLDQLTQDIKSEGPVAWLEERYAVAVVSVVIIFCALFSGYFYGLPALAEKIVPRIPIETEISLGERTLKRMDENNWFESTQVDQAHQESLTERFDQLHDSLAMSPHIRLKFRNSKYIGPNAFALPGGTIIITDQMVEKAESAEEILSILAHEAGHVEQRHSMRQILQTSVIALLAATITADASSVSTAVAGLPAIIAQMKYSRDFETEADDFAFDLLERNKISTEVFASIMKRLDNDIGANQNMSFLSSHPLTAERIERAKNYRAGPE
ncbi:MAG: M48 family metallopeptidase [Desulfobacteraceae bacterium]|nr:M48 family metallopeptidase [Desulfobacteraceae bacterium]